MLKLVGLAHTPNYTGAHICNFWHTCRQTYRNRGFQPAAVLRTQTDLLTQALAYSFLHDLYCISLWQDTVDPCGEFKCHLLSELLRFQRKEKNCRASLHNATVTKCLCNMTKEKKWKCQRVEIVVLSSEVDSFSVEFSSYFSKMLFDFCLQTGTWDLCHCFKYA